MPSHYVSVPVNASNVLQEISSLIAIKKSVSVLHLGVGLHVHDCRGESTLPFAKVILVPSDDLPLEFRVISTSGSHADFVAADPSDVIERLKIICHSQNALV